MRYNLSPEEFSAFVEEAWQTLPVNFQEALENITIVTRPWPTPAEQRRAHVPLGSTLLGLYQGVPLTKRTGGYQLVPPDIITLYQGPIEATCSVKGAVPGKIRHVLVHEIAHYFGISDDRLRELGAY